MFIMEEVEHGTLDTVEISTEVLTIGRSLDVPVFHPPTPPPPPLPPSPPPSQITMFGIDRELHQFCKLSGTIINCVTDSPIWFCDPLLKVKTERTCYCLPLQSFHSINL